MATSSFDAVAGSVLNNFADWDNAVSVTSLSSAGGEFIAPSNGFLRVLCIKQNDTNESVYYLRYGASNGLYALRYRDLGGSQYTYTTAIVPLKKGKKVVVDTVTNMYGLGNTGANGTVCFIPC